MRRVLVLLLLALALLAAADVRGYAEEDDLDVVDEDEDAFEPQTAPRTPQPTSSASNRDADPIIMEVRALRNAAMKHNDVRDHQSAITKLREALTKMHDRVFGPGRLAVTDKADLSQDAALYAQLLGDYGNVLIRAKQPEEAIDVLEDAVAMTERIFGPSHPSLGLSLRSLAEAYMANDNPRAAIKKYKTLRKHVRLGLGEQHEAYVEASLRIAEAYRKMDKHDKAAAAIEKMLRAQGEHVNGLTKGIGEAYMELATAQLAQGKVDEAHHSAETARLIFRERDGDDTLAYAFSLNALAGVKMRRNEVAEAYELLQQAHRIALALFGKGDPIVQASAKTLREVRARLDEVQADKDEL
jgi:tetratricopeptide (TPR) repeat protein